MMGPKYTKFVLYKAGEEVKKPSVSSVEQMHTPDATCLHQSPGQSGPEVQVAKENVTLETMTVKVKERISGAHATRYFTR